MILSICKSNAIHIHKTERMKQLRFAQKSERKKFTFEKRHFSCTR